MICSRRSMYRCEYINDIQFQRNNWDMWRIRQNGNWWSTGSCLFDNPAPEYQSQTRAHPTLKGADCAHCDYLRIQHIFYNPITLGYLVHIKPYLKTIEGQESKPNIKGKTQRILDRWHVVAYPGTIFNSWLSTEFQVCVVGIEPIKFIIIRLKVHNLAGIIPSRRVLQIFWKIARLRRWMIMGNLPEQRQMDRLGTIGTAHNDMYRLTRFECLIALDPVQLLCVWSHPSLTAALSSITLSFHNWQMTCWTLLRLWPRVLFR